MSILAVGVTLPLPAVAGLLIGPGLAAHCIAKQAFAHFEMRRNDLVLCTFSAVVSGVVTFAVIESVAIVAAVALATFSLLLAYEYFHLERAKQKPADLQPLLTAIEALPKEGAQAVDLQPLLTAIEALPKERAQAVDLQPLLTAIEALPKERAQAVDLGPLQQAIEGIKTAVTEAIGRIVIPKPAEPVDLASIHRAVGDLTQQVSKVFGALEKMQAKLDLEGAQAKREVTVAAGGANTAPPEYKVVDVGGILEKLDGVQRSLQAITSMGAKLQHIPQNVEKTLEQSTTAAEQACRASAGHSMLENMLGELKETLRRIELSLTEQKATAQANAMAMHSALNRPQSVPVAPPSMYGGGSVYQWAGALSECGRPPEPRPLSRTQSLHDLRKTPRSSSQSPGARSTMSELRTPPSRQSRSFDAERTPMPLPPRSVAATPDTVKRPQPVPRASTSSGGDLKGRILEEGGKRLFKDYEDMNPVNVPKRYLSNALSKGHFFVNRDLGPLDAAAILHILDQKRLDLNAAFIAVPQRLDLGFGSARFGSLMQADLSKLPRHSALTLAAQEGQQALLEHFLEVGAPTDYVVEDRCYLGFAAAAGMTEVIQKHAQSEFGIGQKVPLVFDAVCADDNGATLRILIDKGLYSKSINTPCGCISKHADRISRFVPRGTAVNAVHLAILLREQAKIEALLKCVGIVWNQKTEAGKSGGGEATPLLLLLDWIVQKRFEPEDWQVGAALSVIDKLKEQGIPSKAIREATGSWYRGEGRHTVKEQLDFAKLIKGCTEATQAALNESLR